MHEDISGSTVKYQKAPSTHGGGVKPSAGVPRGGAGQRSGSWREAHYISKKEKF